MSMTTQAGASPRAAAREAPRARDAVEALEGSRIREVANAGFGQPDVLRFWFGESDQPTPAPIVAAAQTALAEGRTFYTHNLGMPELREAISGYLAALHGAGAAARAVAVTSSGVSALMIAMQAILDPGDRVLAVTPVWPNVTQIPGILGAEVARFALRPEAGRWRLDLGRFLEAITPGTRLVLINAPGNPTGWVLPADDRAAILARCREVGAWLLTDDVYERLAFGRTCAPSFLEIAEPEDRLVSANSFSKTWLMTGWRLGWIVAPPQLEDALGKLIEYNTSCAPEFVQRAGLAAIGTGEPPISALRASLETRASALMTALAALPEADVVRPDGGMYVMVRIRGMDDSVGLARRLVSEAGLGLAPGVAFGPESEGWLRWCVAVRPESLDAGVARLARWLAGAPRG